MPNARSSQACFGVNSCCCCFPTTRWHCVVFGWEINGVTFSLLVSVDIIEPSSTVIRTTCANSGELFYCSRSPGATQMDASSPGRASTVASTVGQVQSLCAVTAVRFQQHFLAAHLTDAPHLAWNAAPFMQ